MAGIICYMPVEGFIVMKGLVQEGVQLTHTINDIHVLFKRHSYTPVPSYFRCTVRDA